MIVIRLLHSMEFTNKHKRKRMKITRDEIWNLQHMRSSKVTIFNQYSTM